jgi:type II secretory pathway component PulF
MLERKGLLVEFVGEAASAARTPVIAPTAAVSSDTQTPGLASIIVAKYEPESLAHLYRQISAMLRSGVPLVTALTTISGGAYSPRIRSALGEIRDAVHAGEPISGVLERRKDVFPPLHGSIIRAAEHGGFLDSAFAQLAEYLGQEIRVRNAWKRRTFYPKVLLVVTFAIIIVTNLVVASIAAKTGGPALLLNNFLLNPWVYVPILIVTFIIVVFLKASRGSAKAARIRDGFAFWLPHYASTAQMMSMAKFSRALALLFGSGVPIRDAVLLAGDAAGNVLIAESVRPLAKKIGDGTSIYDALRESSIFTPETLDMIRAGETTGSLQSLLDHLANHYEEEGKVRMDKFTTVLTTAILILILLAVASTILGFYGGYMGELKSYME